MAILEAVRPGSKKAKKKNLEGIIGYVLNPQKTEILHLADGVNVSVHKALDQMRLTKRYYGKTDGREYYHWVISFPPGEINRITGKPVTPEDVLAFGKRFVEECEITHRGRKNENGIATETKVKPFEGFESLLAVHKDKDHLHVHIINNSVSLMDGTKFQYSINDLAQMKRFKDSLSEELGWQKEPKKGYTKDGVKREGLASGNSRRYRAMKKAADREAECGRDENEKPRNNGSYVDYCKNLIEYHAGHAKSREEFLRLMEHDGYECEWSEKRKNVVFTCVEERDNGRANPKIRLSRFADEFNSEFFSKEGLESAFEKNARSETAINTVAVEIVRTEEIAQESSKTEQETAEKPELEKYLKENGYESVDEPEESIVDLGDMKFIAGEGKAEAEKPTKEEITKNESHLSINERYLIQNPVDPNAQRNPKVDLAGVMRRRREEVENQRKEQEEKQREIEQQREQQQKETKHLLAEHMQKIEERREKKEAELAAEKQKEEAQTAVSSAERKPENILDYLDSLDEPGSRKKISDPLPIFEDDFETQQRELKAAGIPVAETKKIAETNNMTTQKPSQQVPDGWKKREDGVLVAKHGFDVNAALNEMKQQKEKQKQQQAAPSEQKNATPGKETAEKQAKENNSESVEKSIQKANEEKPKIDKVLANANEQKPNVEKVLPKTDVEIWEEKINAMTPQQWNQFIKNYNKNNLVDSAYGEYATTLRNAHIQAKLKYIEQNKDTIKEEIKKDALSAKSKFESSVKKNPRKKPEHQEGTIFKHWVTADGQTFSEVYDARVHQRALESDWQTEHTPIEKDWNIAKKTWNDFLTAEKTNDFKDVYNDLKKEKRYTSIFDKIKQGGQKLFETLKEFAPVRAMITAVEKLFPTKNQEFQEFQQTQKKQLPENENKHKSGGRHQGYRGYDDD